MAPDYAARYPGACRTSCCSTPAACISSPTHRHAPSARGGRAAIVVTSAGANRLRIGGPTSWLTHEPENEIGVSTYRQGHLRRSWPGGYLSQDISAHSLKDGLHTLICVFDRILRPKAEVDCKSRSVDALLATAFGAHRRSSTTCLFGFVGTVGVSASAGRWCECCARSLSRSARCRRTMRGSGGSKTSTERRTGR